MSDKVEKEEFLKGSDGRYSFKLTEPVSHGSEPIKEFSLRAPKAKDLRALKFDDLKAGDLIDVAGECAAQPRSVMNELCAKDTFRLVGFISNFL